MISALQAREVEIPLRQNKTSLLPSELSPDDSHLVSNSSRAIFSLNYTSNTSVNLSKNELDLYTKLGLCPFHSQKSLGLVRRNVCLFQSEYVY